MTENRAVRTREDIGRAMRAAADVRLIDLTRESPRVLLYFLRECGRRHYRDSAQLTLRAAGGPGLVTARTISHTGLAPRRWAEDCTADVDGEAVSVRIRRGGALTWSAAPPKPPGPVAPIDWPDIERGDEVEVDVSLPAATVWYGTLFGPCRRMPAAEAIARIRADEQAEQGATP